MASTAIASPARTLFLFSYPFRPQIVTGRGNRSASRHRAPVREAVLALLQQLAPVRVAAKNDGLLLLSRAQLERLFAFVHRKRRSFSPADMSAYLVAPQRDD